MSEPHIVQILKFRFRSTKFISMHFIKSRTVFQRCHQNKIVINSTKVHLLEVGFVSIPYLG